MTRQLNFKFEKFNCELPEFGMWEYLGNVMGKDLIGNFMMEQQQGFRFSQTMDLMMYYHQNNTKDDEKIRFKSITVQDGKPYIIPTAVQYAPQDWTDWDFYGNQVKGKKSVFELLNPIYLKDLQEGNAMLLIDQSVEGYSNTWLWDWFHHKCYDYKINPQSVIYVTGDQSCSDTYQEWCTVNRPSNNLKVVPSISLSQYIHKHYLRYGYNLNFETLHQYKTENKDKIYLYDCINNKPRPQRVINFLHLFNSGLLEDGNVSMPGYNSWRHWIKLNSYLLGKYKLPANVADRVGILRNQPSVAKHNHDKPVTHFYDLVERILVDMYQNSWVSVVTESSYTKEEAAVFISEKTFKPIAAMQPFIIVGSQGTLKYLRKLGYKTFHPFIDESYDDAPDEDRFEAVMETLKKIKAIENKPAWYENMRHIVEHNHNLFMSTGKVRSQEHQDISNHYFHYFRDKNV